MWGLLLLAAAAAPPPPAPPAADKPPTLSEAMRGLHQQVVDAIRHCGEASGGLQDAITVCSRDRGFSEEEGHRLKKLEKPKPPPESSSPITIQVTNGQTQPPR